MEEEEQGLVSGTSDGMHRPMWWHCGQEGGGGEDTRWEHRK